MRKEGESLSLGERGVFISCRVLWSRDLYTPPLSKLRCPLLLDQGFVAGLGNIYVDESLFLAGLHPLRRSDRVPRERVQRLHAAIQSTLAAAVELLDDRDGRYARCRKR